MLTKYSVERFGGGISLVAEKEYDYPKQSINGPGSLAALLNECFHLDRLTEEHLVMVALTAGLEPAALFEIASGTVTRCMFSPRELFMRALLSGAVCIAVAHNHPGGSLKPSKADDAAYRRIKDAGTVIGIVVTDFLIIGGNGAYYSYMEHAGD